MITHTHTQQKPFSLRELIRRPYQWYLRFSEDRKWDRTLNSPESLAYLDKERAKIEIARRAGTLIEYVPGKTFEEYSHL